MLDHDIAGAPQVIALEHHAGINFHFNSESIAPRLHPSHKSPGLPDNGAPLSLVELVKDNEKYQDQEVLLATRIAKVCQKKGCFFVATEGAVTARVSFKDYEFFIPTDSGGKDVVLLGMFSRKSVSKEEADHYATDLGETATSNPERFQYSIVASAVKIPRS